MKRRKIPIFSLLSLLALLAITALWIRSYYVCDILSWDRENPATPGWRIQWACSSRAGCADFGRREYGPISYDWLFYKLFTTGTSAFGWRHTLIPKPADADTLADFWNRREANSLWNRLGFYAGDVFDPPWLQIDGTFDNELTGWGYTVPYWLAALATGLLPLLASIRFLRAKCRITHGLCAHCNYDLRSHKPGDKCPECGTQISQPQVTS